MVKRVWNLVKLPSFQQNVERERGQMLARHLNFSAISMRTSKFAKLRNVFKSRSTTLPHLLVEENLLKIH